ncbi:MAG: [FeFe] hydrogenase H-cluster radical SAM maturase HydE [Lachnospiraceae bacterium]|nr:[FeFe] hydrogenase H-cluster radical SAM maturase HydE [Lachnospiraceae bacterium]
MYQTIQLIDKLEHTSRLTKEEWIALIEDRNDKTAQYLFERARYWQHKYFAKRIYTRGLIEFTNYCKNDCYYCGIRRSNRQASRYRLTREQILECCSSGYGLGFRTFVLQGGEDGWFTQEKLLELVRAIRKEYPDCALTLSLGERSKESYAELFHAGADRYLLRHETADDQHYRSLHPPELSAERRRQCLWHLKEIGYQTGTGFMVGSPGQTPEHLAEDMLFIRELEPHMVGIGPFVPHHETPFFQETGGTVELTLYMIGLLRVMLPALLLPATTALGTIDPLGREKGIQAGANVVMPNLSPTSVRKKYELYDNKICTGDEAAECRNCLNQRMKNIGYELVIDRGDYRSQIKEENHV